MTTPETDGPVRPVLLQDAEGGLVLAAITNDKGRKKSLENGALWVLDGATGRLIPLLDTPAGEPVRAALAKAGRPVTGRWLSAVELAGETVVAKSDLPSGAVAVSGAAAPAAAPALGDAPADAAAGEAAVLLELERVIRGRKASLPEGSYTTHLFKSGLGKIRKKAGEEAVELLLAQTPEETVSETADLVYHVMVLLAALDIPLERVFAELRRR